MLQKVFRNTSSEIVNTVSYVGIRSIFGQQHGSHLLELLQNTVENQWVNLRVTKEMVRTRRLELPPYC